MGEKTSQDMMGDEAVQDDSHDAPEYRHCLEVEGKARPRARLTQVTTFEELMRWIGTRGRWNIAIITICALGEYCAASFLSPC